ncbi:MAG: hypothetical protein H0U64_13180 [Gemmatimonadaceae bacterium]|nr:hypothetical protein [Gemmatimonadaceae bacterium]
MDTTYQNQLRELNDLNWERFKAELHMEMERLRSEMERLRTEMARAQSSQMEWMFVYWTGTMAVVVYAMLGR